MLVLVIVLVITNLLAVGALGWFLYGPETQPRPDDAIATALDRTPPAGATGSTRRVITIEILNPIELAGTRGRIVGIAGSLAPGLTRRIVYDQTVKILKRQLTSEHVVADVRVHTLRPVPRPSPDRRPVELDVVSEPVVDDAAEQPTPSSVRRSRSARRVPRESRAEAPIPYVLDLGAEDGPPALPDGEPPVDLVKREDQEPV